MAQMKDDRVTGRRVSRALVFAEAALLCIASSTTVAAIVDSGPVSIAIPNTLDGIYFNVLTGTTSTISMPGWDINPYGVNSKLTLFFCPTCGGVGSTSTGPLLALPAGAIVGPGSEYDTGIGVTDPNYLVTGQEYLGIRFVNETTTVINYGYVVLSTSASLGFPATILRYVYDNTGQAITIPTVAPIFNYAPAAASTVPFTGGGVLGSTATASIAIAAVIAGNNTGAASTTTTTCTAPTAPFAGFGQSITATGAAAPSGGPLSGTCIVGAAVVTGTLTCIESRGGSPITVTFTLSCPAAITPLFVNGFE